MCNPSAEFQCRLHVASGEIAGAGRGGSEERDKPPIFCTHRYFEAGTQVAVPVVNFPGLPYRVYDGGFFVRTPGGKKSGALWSWV